LPGNETMLNVIQKYITHKIQKTLQLVKGITQNFLLYYDIRTGF